MPDSHNQQPQAATPDTTPVSSSKATNDPKKSAVTKTHHKKSANKTLSLLQITGLIFIMVILLSAGGGYYLWEFVANAKESIEQQVTSTQTDVSSLTSSLSQSESNLKQQINSVTALQTELSNSVEALLSRSTHMRKDWLVSEAEYLVKLAVNRLALEGDIKTAIIALSNADARLLEAGDPGLLVLRQEISNNITKLKAIPNIDISGMSIKITSIIQQVDKLPLVTPDPESIKQSHQQMKEKNDADTTTNWKDVTSKVVTDLTSLIRIRKHDQIVQPLLSPEQRFYLTQNIKLQLEQARTALLHQQQNIFRERINGSITWIKDYFDLSKTATQSAITLLSDLTTVELTQETPDLSRSLKLFTDFQAGIRLKKKPKSITKKIKVKKKPDAKKIKPVTDKPVTNAAPPAPVIEKSNDQNSNQKILPVTPAKPGVSL